MNECFTRRSRRWCRFCAPILRNINTNVGPIILGLVAGFIIACFTGPNQWIHSTSEYRPMFKEQHNVDDLTVANQLTNEVKILCWIMTTGDNHQSKALHVKNTWGRRCNKLLFMSNEKDSTLDSIALNTTYDYDHLWGKTKASFQYIHANHLNDYDWFLKADDDTYVIVENLRYLLYDHSHETPIYFGAQFRTNLPTFHQIYMSGGAGYVLSREAVRRFVEIAMPNSDICSPLTFGPEDVWLGYCLSNVDVTAGDTRDYRGRGTFFPFAPVAHLVPSSKSPDWYIQYSVYGVADGLQCCSDNAISFHYIEASDMYVFDYLIYSVRPYGIVNYPQLLNKSLTENAANMMILRHGSFRRLVKFITSFCAQSSEICLSSRYGKSLLKLVDKCENSHTINGSTNLIIQRCIDP